MNDREEAEKRLREQTVPRVSQLPGVVAGYWTRSDGPDGLSMVVFESEDAARAAADQVPQMVSLSRSLSSSVDVREVVANVSPEGEGAPGQEVKSPALTSTHHEPLARAEPPCRQEVD